MECDQAKITILGKLRPIVQQRTLFFSATRRSKENEKPIFLYEELELFIVIRR